MVINSTIPTTGADIFASSSTRSYAITAGFFCNTSTTDADEISIYLVRNGQTPSPDNCIVDSYNLTETNTLVFNSERIILENGDYLHAKSKNGTTNATLSIISL